MRQAILLSLAICAFFVRPQDLLGQRLPQEPASVQHLILDEHSPWPASINPQLVSAGAFGHPSDHRWEGAVLAAGVLGITAALLRASSCNEDNSATQENCVGPTVLWGVMGATVGTVVGGLIGSAIRK